MLGDSGAPYFVNEFEEVAWRTTVIAVAGVRLAERRGAFQDSVAATILHVAIR